jgi:hypothetical protein
MLEIQVSNIYQNEIQFSIYPLCDQEEEFLSKNNILFSINHLKM